jgi:para-aminobenzoate synthetase component I
MRPIYQSLPYMNPERAFAPFAAVPHSIFLDSAARVGARGRYSYIAVDPYAVITSNGQDNGDPFDGLEQALGTAWLDTDPDLPPFQGGAVGYLGYELNRHLEHLPEPAITGAELPELMFGLYDTVLAFDHDTRQCWAIATDPPNGPPNIDQRASAEDRLGALVRRIAACPTLTGVDWSATGGWSEEIPQHRFEAMIARTVDYIHGGDILQANITQRFLGDLPPALSPWMLYRRLREISPNPYAAYLNCGNGQALASASPEMFLRLERSGRVLTRPIKGTRPRGADALTDQQLSEALLASDKDRAENLMIVDLMRNDLARASRIGSVRVNELLGLETFTSIHHLVSEIEALVLPDVGPVDLLRATFPGGSITGAPKVRAMEIIRELEPARRGPYCGSIAWVGFDGAMESSIVIRTLVIDGDNVIAQAGGGIVADSRPEDEYRESLDKAAVLLTALDPSWRDRGLGA